MNDDHSAPDDRTSEGSAASPGSAEQPGSARIARRPATRYVLSPPRERVLRAVTGATPGIRVLRHYRKDWLRSDVYAGISVVAYMVPQVMAYTALVGVPPVVGLWTALAALIVYAALGSSRVLSVGPESTIALMAGTAIAPLAAADPDRAVALGAALSLIVGGWCLLGRIARLGVIADLLSQPLLVGYLAGAAVLMVVGQLGKMTGTTVEGDNLVAQLKSFAGVVDDTHLLTLAVGAGTLGLLLVIHFLRPRWPATLIAVATATVVCVLADLEEPWGRGGRSSPDRAADARPPRRDVGGRPDAGVRRARDRGDRLQRQHADRPRASQHRPPNDEPTVEPVDPQQEFAALAGVQVAVRSDERLPGLVVRIPHGARHRGPCPQSAVLAGRRGIRGPRPVRRRATDREPATSLARRRGVLRREQAGVVAGVPCDSPASARPNCYSLSPPPWVPSCSASSSASAWRSRSACSRCCSDWLAPTKACSGGCPGWPECTTSTTTPTRRRLPGLVVYRYDAPLFFANVGDMRRRALLAVEQENAASPSTPCGGSCSTSKRTSRSTSPPPTGYGTCTPTSPSRASGSALARVKHDLRIPLERAGLADLIGEDMLFPTLPVAEEAYLAWASSTNPEPSPGAPPGPSTHTEPEH